MKKLRPDAFDAKLQPNQLAALERWLFEDAPALTYDEAAKRIYQDFGMRVSRSAVCEFYKRVARKRLEKSIVERAHAANSVLDKVEKNPADMYRAVLSLVGHMAFENATTLSDPELLYNFTKLMISARKEELRGQSLELERLKLAENMKSDIEQGIDALWKEIKDKPEAVEAFDKFRAIVTGASKPVITEREKVNAIRRKMFGALPEDQTQKTN